MENFIEIEGVKYEADASDPTVAQLGDDGEMILFDEESKEEESEEEESEEEEKSKETVSLKKHLKLKAKLKESQSKGSISEEDRKLLNEIRQGNAEKALKEAYSDEFEKLIIKYPDLEGKDKQLFKLVQVTGNEDKSLEEVALETYGDFIAKSSSEDDESGESEDNLDTSKIDFDNMDDAQTAKVLADPKAKKKFYAHCDSK